MLEIKEQKVDKAQFEEAAYMLKALANEIRLSVITLLS
ncbi:MAG TPA: transcriptional regulator, partial [Porphyromonadaceae bacterium]|nr:transcriptional regulator [Porphyromonadaceae bacterium]